ncbi:MAG: glycosyltransferase family 39 protein, partial [Anaerolineales bacterium]|nr:glycosyltransferase family 39 protein [Anaerolineales bacterium]
MTKRTLLATVAVALIANGALFLPLPHLATALAALIVTGFLPGALLVHAVVGQGPSRPDWMERVLYSGAAGFALMVLGMLLIAYQPGAPTKGTVLLLFNAITGVLLGWVLWRGRRVDMAGPSAWRFDAGPRWIMAGALTLLIVGSVVRFGNLGYADFQGDEARAALRSAAILQGYEDVLMLHKKGPTEILLPTLLYTLTGHLTEATARLPFAIANLLGLFAVWILGWRLFNPMAGWIAALFFALDGYFIGFSRIVQYQSVVFLMSILVVLLLYRTIRQPRALVGYLTLAALFLATGLLSHYEGALVALPAVFLWGVLAWRNRNDLKRVLGATAVAVVVGGIAVGSFYLPFVLHPRFSATLYYLTDRRIGGSPPYNNLVDVFVRTTLYSTTYQVLLAIGLLIVGMVRIYWRGLRRPLAWAAIVALLVVTVMTFLNPQWLTFGERDWIFAPWFLLLLLVILMPKLAVEERVLWLWFGAVMMLALFFTEKPRTHVYTFFIPWFMIAGQVLALGWQWLRGRIGFRYAAVIGVAGAAIALLAFGNYA